MALKAANVDKVEQKTRVTIALDKTNEQILALDQDDKVELVFDFMSFRKLPEEVVTKLKVVNQRSYWIAEAKAEEYANNVLKTPRIFSNPLGNTSDAYVHQLYIRPRPGFHQYWAAPGADFDRCMMSGNYHQVRKQKVDVNGNSVEKDVAPGEETGEVLKRIDAEGKVEAIALECREEHYLEYLQWMDQQSTMKYRSIKDDFMTNVENLNRDAKSRSSRITPMDLDEEGRPK